MHEWLVAITNSTVLVIDAMVLVIIAIGTIQAFVQGLRVMLLPSATGHERRSVWLCALAGRWPHLPTRRRYPCDLNRSELVRLATVAVIRTLLNFFLEHMSDLMAEFATRAKKIVKKVSRTKLRNCVVRHAVFAIPKRVCALLRHADRR